METFEAIKKTESKQNAANSFFGAAKNGLPFIQPKLTINQPNDVYEQEADAMADKVMRMEQPGLQLKPLPITGLQRKCAHCEEEEKQTQRKEMNAEETIADNNLEHYVGSLNNGGQALPNEVKNFYEPRFGYDFSNVKLHTGTVAAKSAQSINALAYTSGNNIVFNEGQYSPNTDGGKKLLGHELTHVVQQGNSIAPKKIQRDWDWGRAGWGALAGGIGGAVVGGLVGGVPGAIAGGIGGAVVGGIIGGLSGGAASNCTTTKTVTVDFVKLRGSTRSPTADLARANSIFGACCVRFTAGRNITATTAQSDSWLGGDTDISSSTSCTPTTEESNAFTGAGTAFGLSSRIRVFYVDSISGAPFDAYSFNAGCGSATNEMAVVSNAAGGRELSHEFGHILLNQNNAAHVSDPANLMADPNPGTQLDAGQCSSIFGGLP